MGNDPPLFKTINLIEKLLPKYDVLIFLTGRPENYRYETEKWIQSNTNFKNYQIMMISYNNFDKDINIKREMLKKVRKEYKVDTVFEDQIE